MKSPATGAGKVSNPRLMSEVGRHYKVMCMYISVALQSEHWGCQYSSPYIAAVIM